MSTSRFTQIGDRTERSLTCVFERVRKNTSVFWKYGINETAFFANNIQSTGTSRIDKSSNKNQAPS